MQRGNTDGHGTAAPTGTCPDCRGEVVPVPT